MQTSAIFGEKNFGFFKIYGEFDGQGWGVGKPMRSRVGQFFANLGGCILSTASDYKLVTAKPLCSLRKKLTEEYLQCY